MNTVPNPVDKSMMDALRCITEDSNAAASLDIFASSILDDRTLFNSPPFLSTSDLSTDCLSLDFNHSDPTLSYTHLSTSDVPSSETPFQVDHTGAKVTPHEPSSAWLPSTLTTDVPRSVSMCTSSSTAKYTPSSPACATVAAAAVTAAMIVVRDDVVLKRPRSPASDSTDDSSTEASLNDSEDPCSPRSVSTFVKDPLASVPQSYKSAEHRIPTSQSIPPTPQISSTVNPTKDTSPLHIRSSSQADDTNASASKKRRAEAMERFRRKKAVRCYGRRVRYQIRKRIATTRPRVNGRFARRTDALEQAGSKTANPQ